MCIYVYMHIERDMYRLCVCLRLKCGRQVGDLQND